MEKKEMGGTPQSQNPNIVRCRWCCDNGVNQKYHDEEWGIPVHDDRKQFEFLMMEVMQCGLNWTMMLKKREIFKKCFDNFDPEKVALYTEEKIQEILEEPGMIRSRRKIEAVINNAKQFQKIAGEFGSFDTYLWAFSDRKMILYRGHEESCFMYRMLTEKYPIIYKEPEDEA